MKNKKQIQAIYDFIISSEKSLKSAKKLLADLIKDNNVDLEKEVELNTNWLHSYESEDSKIVEWVFTGEEMYWVDGEKYPIPANYASKSKMVQWDKLKLTIAPNWKMTYKQIWPIERETTTWLLTKDKWKFQAISNDKTYDLLTAAVTHFDAKIWDNLALIIPKWKQATFAAIDSIIK